MPIPICPGHCYSYGQCRVPVRCASRFPILNLQWDDDAYGKGLAGLFQDFLGRKKELPYEDLRGVVRRVSPAERSRSLLFSAAIVTFFEPASGSLERADNCLVGLYQRTISFAPMCNSQVLRNFASVTSALPVTDVLSDL